MSAVYSAEDRRRALDKATRIKMARAALRHEAARLPADECRALVRDILRVRPDCVLSAHVEEVVSWAYHGPHRWRHTGEALRTAGIGYGGKEVRQLSERQAAALVEAIQA